MDTKKAHEMRKYVADLRNEKDPSGNRAFPDLQILSAIAEGLHAVEQGRTSGEVSDIGCQFYLFLK